MPRGGARSGAGRKATDCPGEPLSTYSFRIRLEDTGVLNRLGHGNLSRGLRRLIDQARAAGDRADAVPGPRSRSLGDDRC